MTHYQAGSPLSIVSAGVMVKAVSGRWPFLTGSGMRSMAFVCRSLQHQQHMDHRDELPEPVKDLTSGSSRGPLDGQHRQLSKASHRRLSSGGQRLVNSMSISLHCHTFITAGLISFAPRPAPIPSLSRGDSSCKRIGEMASNCRHADVTYTAPDRGKLEACDERPKTG